MEITWEQVYRNYYRNYWRIVKNRVGDPTDADFAALALYLSEEFGKVIYLRGTRKTIRLNVSSVIGLL